MIGTQFTDEKPSENDTMNQFNFWKIEPAEQETGTCSLSKYKEQVVWRLFVFLLVYFEGCQNVNTFEGVMGNLSQYNQCNYVQFFPRLSWV